jgi:hypothetical protein
MSSEAFIISSSRNADPSAAIRQAVESAGVNLSRIQDLLLSLDGSVSVPIGEIIVRDAGLSCPTTIISSGLRAVIFAAQSILSGDVELVVVLGVDSTASTSLLLASPEAVGKSNLVPRARIAARSLAGVDVVLRFAEITSGDVTVTKQGEDGILLLNELMDELEATQAQWGLVTTGQYAIVMERI